MMLANAIRPEEDRPSGRPFRSTAGHLLSGAIGVVAFCASAIVFAQYPIKIDTPLAPPEWAVLERQLLAEQTAPAREFYQKYYDDRGYLQCVLRWGADDGPDDAFENFNHWPELHALGADDAILDLYRKGNEGMILQYTDAKTVEVPSGRDGMYSREFSAMSDWMHHGEGMQIFNRMGLSVPNDPKFIQRARTFAGFYMGEDPLAPNYDPEHKLIESLMNGSKGPMLRKAEPIDWTGDPFDPTAFVMVHRERNFGEVTAHYAEYTDVEGDGFLNLVATTLPTTAYLLTREDKYRAWVVDYMDAWLERMKANHGIIPSFVDLDGKIGGPDGKWWGNFYGWGFSPVNPVNGRRENRNRIPRAVVGFDDAILVTGDMKYADAWRAMIDSINSNARTENGVKSYPTMYGADGWYGWQRRPWSVGAIDLWFWTMRADDLERIADNPWVAYLQGGDPAYPETALRRDLDFLHRRMQELHDDKTPPEKRLADNMLDLNPATISALVQLMLGGLPPGADGGLLNASLRYFDPARKRAGIPEDVSALVSKLGPDQTVVTLVNTSKAESRTVIVQGGAYGEHQIKSVEWNGKTTTLNGPIFAAELAPGCGATLTLSVARYANRPSLAFPWDRR